MLKYQRVDMPARFETEYRDRAARRTLETGRSVSRNDEFIKAVKHGLTLPLPDEMPDYLTDRTNRKSVSIRMPENFQTAYHTLASEAERKWGVRVSRNDMFVWALTLQP